MPTWIPTNGGCCDVDQSKKDPAPPPEGSDHLPMAFDVPELVLYQVEAEQYRPPVV